MLLTEWNWEEALKIRYEESYEEGFKFGTEEVAKKVAEKMNAERMDVNAIAEFTGLTVDDISRLCA